MTTHRPTPFKAEKMTDLIKELASKFVQEESNGPSLVTVTRVILAQNKKHADIFFTTLPEDKEQAVLLFLKRKTNEFKLFVRKNSRIGILPMFRFEIDKGERNRQRIDELSTESNQNQDL